MRWSELMMMIPAEHTMDLLLWMGKNAAAGRKLKVEPPPPQKLIDLVCVEHLRDSFGFVYPVWLHFLSG